MQLEVGEYYKDEWAKATGYYFVKEVKGSQDNEVVAICDLIEIRNEYSSVFSKKDIPVMFNITNKEFVKSDETEWNAAREKAKQLI